jgi:hypothetical protein
MVKLLLTKNYFARERLESRTESAQRRGFPTLTSISFVNLLLLETLAGIGISRLETEMQTTRTTGAKRGFAAMDPAKQREIASKGGKSSHGGGRKPLAR